MRNQLLIASAALTLTYLQMFLPISAIAAQLCDDKERFVGSCFSVQGRLSISNGTPSVRILPKGSKRVLGVVNDGDVEDRALPKEVAKLISVETHIHGDFDVCPLTEPKPKQIQMVCLLSGKNLIIRKTR